VGKTVGKILKIVGKVVVGVALVTAVVLGVMTGNPAVVGWALGQFSSVILAGTIAMSVGQMLDPPTFTDSLEDDQSGLNLSLTGNPTEPRKVLFGKAATGGNIIYRANTGNDGEDLHIVIGLAGHLITSFDSFKFGADIITFTANNADGDLNGFLFKYDHLGADDQTADTNLVANSTEWTTAHRLRGIAYSYLKAIWDQEKFPNGLQKMIFTISGTAVYDPRLDSTNGGSGSQRFDDQSTWVFSDNPILCMATYGLGLKVGGEVIAGMEISPSRIDWPSVIAQANICDELVALKAGGTEKRYTCNGWINTERDHRSNLTLLSSACAGGVAFQAALWRSYAAAAIPAIKTRSGFNIMGPKSYTTKRGLDAMHNGIQGRFSDPSSDYSLVDYPARNNATFLVEDGGQENIMQLDFPMTKSQTMCQRLSKIALGRNRMQRSLDAVFSPVALEDTVLDTITFNYAPFNLVNQKMRISDWELVIQDTEDGPLLLVKESLIEDDDDIYAWDETTDELDFVGPVAVPSSKMLNITAENFQNVATAQGLPAGIKADQGDGVKRVVSIGNSQRTARDGDAITFNQTWDANNLPEVEFYNGGLTFDSGGTLTGDQVQQFKALNISASGFTAELLLSSTAGATTLHTDGPGTETTTDVWELDKSQAAEAWDDQYTFQIDVTLGSRFIVRLNDWVPTNTAFGFYTNDGGGFVQRATLTLISDGGSSSNTALNQTKTITVDGLGQHAGFEFKVLIESGNASSSIDNLDSVKYSTAGAPTTINATPTTVSPVPYVVKGGLDS
jgi:hypothetical protein